MISPMAIVANDCKSCVNRKIIAKTFASVRNDIESTLTSAKNALTIIETKAGSTPRAQEIKIILIAEYILSFALGINKLSNGVREKFLQFHSII